MNNRKYICLVCQVAFKGHDNTGPVCGNCGEGRVLVSYTYRAPKKRDDKSWARLRDSYRKWVPSEDDKSWAPPEIDKRSTLVGWNRECSKVHTSYWQSVDDLYRTPAEARMARSRRLHTAQIEMTARLNNRKYL